MCKEHIVQVVPGLIVAEHEERNQGGSGDDQQWQHAAGGTRRLQPGCDLPAAEVCNVVQQKTSQRHKVCGNPRVSRVFIHGLDARGKSRENHDGDEENVEDAAAQNPGLLQDGFEGRHGSR